MKNGGYFIFRPEIFNVLHDGEDLVTDAFPRLAATRKLLAIPHDGFWASMDTMKERIYLQQLHEQGRSPWEVWTPRALKPKPAARPSALSVESMYVQAGLLSSGSESRAATRQTGGAA